MATINPVSTKMTITLNTTPAGGAAATSNVTIGKLDTAITAAKISAMAAAVTPLYAYSIVAVGKTDVGALVE